MKYLALLLVLPGLASAKPGTELVADGFERPIYVDAPAGNTDRLWIVEQAGTIWLIDPATGERDQTPFLDVRDQVSRENNEEGLLGLAFAADYKESGRFYIYYTDKNRTTHIERLTATGNDKRQADPDSAERLVSFKQPFGNHNGGWIGFGPDGMLYISTGDGGAANDPEKNGQDPHTLLGAMLRIDVSPETGYEIPADNPFADGEDGAPEVWAFGLRNAWRNSFDRETGELWIADVGQNKWEEINVVTLAEGNGANFGWRLREGDQPTPDVGGAKPENHIDPIYVYDHGVESNEGLSVTGGYVYRGPVEELRGRYIFADYQNQRVWSFLPKDRKVTDFQDHTDDFKIGDGMFGLIMSFGEDPQGNVYIATFDGKIMRITGG